jgi:aminopeptidase N
MVRDGEMAARDYVRLVLGGVDSVRDISVVQTLLRQATVAARQYADPAWSADGLAFIASSLRSLLAAAPAGSDHQLAYLRAFAAVATSTDDLDFLAGLLDGTAGLDGLAVDTDLRWSLLRRLVSRGVRGEEAVDAELSRDATDAGERHAAGCRAAIPTLMAKRDTWEALTDGKLTIAMFRATIVGFADQDQPDLVHPYRPEYFAALAGVWGDWSSAMAQDFVEYGYSIGAVDASTIEATDVYLESSPEAPAALRRLLVEGRDEVARAIRNQYRDREAAEG